LQVIVSVLSLGIAVLSIQVRAAGPAEFGAHQRARHLVDPLHARLHHALAQEFDQRKHDVGQLQARILFSGDGRWPLETAAFQSFRPNAKTRPVPGQDLHHVPATVEEHEQMARGRLQPEHRFGQDNQPREALPHVGRVFGEVDLGMQRWGDHVTGSTAEPVGPSIAARIRPKALGSKMAGTRITCPRG
jgi:hypothetical protein